jgi:glycosyltransferase involved in cell wall biosynthesis
VEIGLKVSVVIPSFNHARFLPTTLESVLRQTHRDLEVVFLDDGSQDESVEIAQSYTDRRLRVLQNPSNLGTYGALNAGIDLAEGDLIAVLNSDDFWLPEKLERQVALLATHKEAAFSYTLGAVVDDEGHEMEDFGQHRDYPSSELQEVLPFLLDVNQILASSVVFRRGAVRFDPQLRYCGDWVGAIQLSIQGPAAFVNSPLTFWRQHSGNASKQLLKTMPEEIAVRSAILAETQSWLGGRWETSIARQRLARSALDLGAHLALAADIRSARARFREARSLHPSNKTALKRLLASYLPEAAFLHRLWPEIDYRTFRQSYRENLRQLRPISFSPSEEQRQTSR